MARPVAVHYLVVLIGSLMVPWPVPAQRGSLGVSPRFGNHTRRPGGSSLSLLEVRAAYPRLHRDVYQLKLKFHKLQKDTKNELLALSEEVTNATSLFDSVDSLSEITQRLNKQLRRIRKNARKREQDQDLKLATLMSVIDGMKRQLTSAMTGVAPSSQLDDLSGRVHRQGEAIEALLAENADLRRESGSLSELLEVQREHFERLERWMNNSISGKARSPRVHGDSKHRKHDGVCNVKHYLHFPGSSPTDVASFGNNFPIALRAFSICFWLRTRAPYLGTILSYATSDNDNKLVLYGRNSSKTGLQLVIGDPEHRELPVDRLLGGSWHHVCIMWSAHGGRYAFYIDRRLAAAGSGLRQGYTIPSDGFLVLGQEQDLPGGGFESHESFVGNIAGFALWTRFLAPGEVSALATGRRMPMEGLILTLSDLAMVHGQVSLSECECLDDCL